MDSAERAIPVLPERIRLAVCLLHAVPGASGVVELERGERHLVAHRDAALTPCELRASLLRPVVANLGHLTVRSVEVVGGAIDTGGGLYRRSHPSIDDERWFATTLGADQVVAIAAECPADIDHRDVNVRVSADVDLGTCAVCVSAEPSVGPRLDRVARWLHAQCLVDELAELLCAPRSV